MAEGHGKGRRGRGGFKRGEEGKYGRIEKNTGGGMKRKIKKRRTKAGGEEKELRRREKKQMLEKID